VDQIGIHNGFDMEQLKNSSPFGNLFPVFILTIKSPTISSENSPMMEKNSSSMAYKMQFEGLVSTTPNAFIWKVRDPPKCIIFSWLAMQDRIERSDRLKGWTNGGNWAYASKSRIGSASSMKM
jgi:hypothetical protein